MNSDYSDTDPSIETLQISLLRQASPARKLEMLAELNAAAQMLALMGLRSLYIHESETKIRRRLAGLLLGDELAEIVYGDLDESA